MHNKNMQLMQV